YGNQTVARNFGLDGAAYDDERFITTTYALGGNALSLWVINKPDTKTVTDENGALVSRSDYYYDGTPFAGVKGQIQDRALLSRRVDYIDATHTIDATRTRYDAFGNMEETHDPVGNVRLVTWDPVFKTYPITETMVVGGGSGDLSISAAYDYAFGVITNSIDFNGHLTTYQYDSFARLTRVVRPGDTFALPTS